MDKGWGLTLENPDQRAGFFTNKPVFGFNLSPRLNPINSAGGSGGGSGMFPLNFGRSEDHSAAEKRAPPNEVDFFSEKKLPAAAADIVVKKEITLHGEPVTKTDLNVNTGLQLVIANTGSDQSTVDDSVSSDMEERRAKNDLSVLQVELEKMNAENQRLRGMLSQVSNNYNALQLHLANLQQQQNQQSSRTGNTQDREVADRKSEEKKPEKEETTVPRQFLELVPAAGAAAAAAQTDEPSQSHTSSEERTVSAGGSPRNNMELSRHKGIAREESPDSESWAPNKLPKLNSSKPVDQAAEATMRKARVSVRARSEAPMISDGCQWRKYGQKMAKGNPCPRAYYRCTMAVGCPVRKQVQRCAEDRTILITTYEGTHNHPLPPAAMAMASTTSAAANMLLSGSMPSADGMMNPNFLARAILPCSSSMATISASAPFPTVTLDLTQNPNSLPNYSRPPTQFQTTFAQAPHTPQNYTQLPQVFGQGLYNQSKFSGLHVSHQDIGAAAAAQLAPRVQHAQQPQHPLFSDTLSAATAAITSDPNFTAALAAAITSIMGGASQPNNANNTTNAATTSTSNNNKTTSFPGN